MKQAKLSPSIMCVPQWQDVVPLLQEMQEAHVEYLHADVMDGHFVPNLMLGTAAVKELRRVSPIPLDLHFMVERPEEVIGWFDVHPGELVSVHAESTRHLQRLLVQIKESGAYAQVALNPSTPLCVIEEVLPDISGVLLMTVNPGFAGQKLVPQMLDKITRLRTMLDERGFSDVSIEVDGNVSFENAVKMRAVGADMFVCGTASLFSGQDTLKENIVQMRRCIQ